MLRYTKILLLIMPSLLYGETPFATLRTSLDKIHQELDDAQIKTRVILEEIASLSTYEDLPGFEEQRALSIENEQRFNRLKKQFDRLLQEYNENERHLKQQRSEVQFRETILDNQEYEDEDEELMIQRELESAREVYMHHDTISDGLLESMKSVQQEYLAAQGIIEAIANKMEGLYKEKQERIQRENWEKKVVLVDSCSNIFREIFGVWETVGEMMNRYPMEKEQLERVNDQVLKASEFGIKLAENRLQIWDFPDCITSCKDHVFQAMALLPTEEQLMEIEDLPFGREAFTLLISPTVNGLEPLAEKLALEIAEEVLLDVSIGIVFPQLAALGALAKAKFLLKLPAAGKKKLYEMFKKVSKNPHEYETTIKRIKDSNSATKTGRGKNHQKSDPSAGGDHSTYRTNENGDITHYETYKNNPKNPSGYDPVKRVDTQHSDPHTHINKKIGEVVDTPHVHDKSAPGGVRPAEPHELPNGGK